MEKELKSDDFTRMQQQAIQRVKEMQQRSKLEGNQNTGSDKENQKNKNEAKTNSRPQNKSSFKAKQANENEQPKSMLSSLFRLDSDAALILPLMLLLSREGTDDILLLALLYIMT